MKKIIFAVAAAFSLSSFAECEMKTIIDVSLPAMVKTIGPAEEGNLDCAAAYLDYLANGEMENSSTGMNLPVLLLQSFDGESSGQLDIQNIIRVAQERKIALSFVYVGELMTLRAVHVRYMIILDQHQ